MRLGRRGLCVCADGGKRRAVWRAVSNHLAEGFAQQRRHALIEGGEHDLVDRARPCQAARQLSTAMRAAASGGKPYTPQLMAGNAIDRSAWAAARARLLR
jgi:hypothetical protein